MDYAIISAQFAGRVGTASDFVRVNAVCKLENLEVQVGFDDVNNE